MSEEIPPQQPYSAPYTNVPYTNVPNPGPEAYPPPPQGGYPPQGAYPPQGGYPPPAASTGLSENAAAALSYVTIIPAIIFLVLEPYNKMPLVKFHSIQCLGLALTSFVLQIGLTVVSLMLHAIPLIGILFAILHFVVFLGIFVAWLIALIQASQGKWFKLPIIGDFAEKQARS